MHTYSIRTYICIHMYEYVCTYKTKCNKYVSFESCSTYPFCIRMYIYVCICMQMHNTCIYVYVCIQSNNFTHAHAFPNS